jgi:hypothetical protein
VTALEQSSLIRSWRSGISTANDGSLKKKGLAIREPL